MGKKNKCEINNGTLLLYNCKAISMELCDDPKLIDYVLDDCQFRDRMAEYYKGYHMKSFIAKDDYGGHHDTDNLVDTITVAIMPFTLENINLISRELAIMRSTNSQHILRYTNVSHLGSYFVIEYPFLLRLSDFIDIVKKEKKDYQITGCIPQQPMVKIVYGILNGLYELHQMKVWHSILDSTSICLSVHNAKILVANYTDIKPSKCKNEEDGPLANHMAPEQLIHSKRNTGKSPVHDFGRCVFPNITEKVDIWALGMLIYEMAIGKPLYKKETEQSKHFGTFIDKILLMPFPTLAEMFPGQYDPLIDEFLSCCVLRNVAERSCACELLGKFHDLFKKFDSDENLILEAVEDSRSVLASFSQNQMEKWAGHVVDQPDNAKLAIPSESIIPIERLKWKRFKKSRIEYYRSSSLSFGDCHLMIKIRKESMLLSRLNPFIFIQSSLPPYNTRAISYIQEAIFQLVKKKVINKFQALVICSVISQLTEFNLLDEENVATEFVVSETFYIDQQNCMQSVLIPLEPMTTNEIICDSKTLYHSVLLEYVYPSNKNI